MALVSFVKLIREFIELVSCLFANIKAQKPLMFFDLFVRLEIKMSEMLLSFKNKVLNASPLTRISLSSNIEIISLIITKSVVSDRDDKIDIFVIVSPL